MIGFSICNFIYISIFAIFYFSKKRIKSLDNKIYSYILISNFIGIFLDIFGYLSFKSFGPDFIINIFISKTYLLYYYTWAFLFLIYVYIISFRKSAEEMLSRSKLFWFILFIISLIYIIILILPINIVYNNNIAYTNGLSVYFVYILSFIMVALMIFCLIKNIKKLNSKEYVPLLAFLFLSLIVMFIQLSNPEITLILTCHSIVTALMYFTIENPDMKMLEEVILANNTAEKANKVKSEFLSSMSHEIRTPMNAIMGCTDILESEDNLSNDGKEILSELKNATNSLLDICSGILNVSQIESGDLEIKVCEYNPVDTFNDLYKLIKNRVKDNATFRTDFSSDIPEILHGDKDKIKEIIINLLTNATKYTDNGEICFKVDSNIKDDICNLTITISDTGIGISEELIDKIFDNFVRDESVNNSSTLGLGLGLSITRSLVNLMDGKINVKSQVGKGTEFVVVIPQKLN